MKLVAKIAIFCKHLLVTFRQNPKFGHLAEKSGFNLVSNLSTKAPDPGASPAAGVGLSFESALRFLPNRFRSVMVRYHICIFFESKFEGAIVIKTTITS